MKQIHSYCFSNSNVKVKLEENSQIISITHATGFENHFPGIDLSPPSQMCQSFYIDPVMFDFYDVKVFVGTIWCILYTKVGFL